MGGAADHSRGHAGRSASTRSLTGDAPTIAGAEDREGRASKLGTEDCETRPIEDAGLMRRGSIIRELGHHLWTGYLGGLDQAMALPARR
jgi:hypothetical protein